MLYEIARDLHRFTGAAGLSRRLAPAGPTLRRAYRWPRFHCGRLHARCRRGWPVARGHDRGQRQRCGEGGDELAARSAARRLLSGGGDRNLRQARLGRDDPAGRSADQFATDAASGQVDFRVASSSASAFNYAQQKLPAVVIAASFQKEPSILLSHPGVDSLPR